jgi:hypothetical protein
VSSCGAGDVFRAELVGVQEAFSDLDDLFVEIRDGRPPPPRQAAGSERERRIAEAMAQPLPWEIDELLGGIRASEARDINDAERAAIKALRTNYAINEDKEHAIGLAISGGGNRSATFALGAGRSNTRPQPSRPRGQYNLWPERVSGLDATGTDTRRICEMQVWMGGIAPLPNEGRPMTSSKMESDLAKNASPTLTILNDGKDTFVVADGVTIAKRGLPGTAHAGTWISLEPGWTVSFNKGQSELLVKIEDVQVH